MKKEKPQSKSIDLSEYKEEAIPFDVVIRQLGKTKPHPPSPTQAKPKTTKVARKHK